MKVKIDRDSVHAGDDIDSHDEYRRYEPQMHFGAVLQSIVNSGFIPLMRHENTSWIVRVGGSPVAVFNPLLEKFSFGVDPKSELGSVISDEGAAILFEYVVGRAPVELFRELFPRGNP